MLIEDAREGDLPQMVAILNHVIDTSTAVFSETPVTLAEQGRWLRERRDNGFPVLVARDGDVAVAYATYGGFRPHSGYRTTVEHTVHVAPDRRREGIGRALLETLIGRAREDGRHVMIAGIDAANVPSVAFHQRLGFVEVARIEEVARKWDRWLDLVLLALRL